MIRIKHKLENYEGRDTLELIASDRFIQTSIYSRELPGISLELRAKPFYKWYHAPVLSWGVFLLSKVWKKFEVEKFKKSYATTYDGVLYASMDDTTIKQNRRYLELSYDLVEHELFHAWQKKKYFMFSVRYGVSKKFRLMAEIEAYIYGYRDKITFETEEDYVRKIANSLTGGAYFSSIDRKTVEAEIRRQLIL